MHLTISLLFALVFQATEPPRIGNFAQSLSAQDVAAIERDALAGKKAWLLVGPYGQSGQTIAAYTVPDTGTAEVRRGSMTTVRRDVAANRWVAARSMKWVQVSINGRDFNAIEGSLDLNRPFTLNGSLDDAELVRIVRLIRSNTAVEHTWPINNVLVESSTSIQVMLSGPDMFLQRVILQKQGENWVVSSTRKGQA
jgi:hypothetical protein